jgi:hypothetical protein
MVWVCILFFLSRKSIYYRYKEFFGTDEQVEQEDSDGISVPPPMGKKEASARFYFALSYQLAKENILNFEQIDSQSLYLCLNICSLEKDRYETQKRELQKLKNK